MKRVLSCIVSALVAVSFAGLVAAAEHGPTDTGPADAQPPMNMKSDTDAGAKSAKPVKKAKKKHKKVKKTKKPMKDTTDMGATPQTAPAPAPAPAGQ